MEAIEQTPPSASAAKTAIPADAEAKDADEAETTMSDIDRLVSNIFADVTTETNVATEETMATVPDKGKEIDKTMATDSDEGILIFGTWAVRSCPRKTRRS